MSTKTLRKRIALATVAALGAGVLSLVSTTAAHAGALVGTYPNNGTAGGTNAAVFGGSGTAGALLIGVAASANGSAVALPNSGDTSTVTSVGLVNVSDLAGTQVAGTTQTAVLLSSGALSVYEKTVGSYDAISVTGGYVSSSTGSYLNGTATLASMNGAGAYWGTVIKPTSGSTSMTISLYNGNTANNKTDGTLTGQITVSIAASSTAGVLSTAKSGVYYAPAYNTTGLSADSTATATEAAPVGGTGEYGIKQYAKVRLADSYGTPLAVSSTGLLTATATNGGLVALTYNSSGTPTNSSAFFATSSNADEITLTVTDPSNAPLSTTVTVAYNGTTVGTKSFTFSGAIAKITLSSPSNGSIASPNTATATIAFADAAGNAVYPSATSTQYPGSNLQIDASTTNTYVTGGSVAYASQWPTSSSAGVYTFTTGSSAGSAKVAVKYTNLDGTVITSNAIAVAASGPAYSYTAALDKTTYAPGDIAKLTVTFKDSKGNLANDNAAIAGSGTSVPTISGSNLSNTNGSSTTNGNASDSTSNGVATYKFIVGAPTTDPYAGQILVDFPVVDGRNSAQAAITVPYTIKSGTTSLNDVLKGIVSLIASINKQIAALAKLVAPAKKK